MSHSVTWLDDKRHVIVSHLEEETDFAATLKHLDTIAAMLDSVDHPVYICHNVTQVRRIPQLKVTELARIARHPAASHPNRAGTYFIGANRRTEFVFDLGQRIFPTSITRVEFVATLEEALQDIEQRTAQRDRNFA